MSECHRKRVLSSERKGGVPALSLCAPGFDDDDELRRSLMVHSSPGASAKCLSEGGGFCFFFVLLSPTSAQVTREGME